MLRTTLAVVAGVAIFLAIVLYVGIWNTDNTTRPPHDQTHAEQFGSDLYTATAFPALDPDVKKAKTEPLVLHGTTAIKDKQEVPSLVSGQILFIGQPIPDGVVEAVGILPFLAEPYGFNTAQVGKTRVYKFYRRLLPDDPVRSDEVIGMVDCSKALALINEKEVGIRLALNDEKSAKAAADEAASRYVRDLGLSTKGGISAAELSASLAAKEKFYYDYKAKGDAVDKAKEDLKQAQILYNQHEITNKVVTRGGTGAPGFKHAVIQFIHKQRGDPVKDQDVVMTVHSLDHLQVEALVDSSYLDRFTTKTSGTVEPNHPARPRFQYLGAHRGEVTAIAVTNDVTAPRVVSAGADRIVSVRDPVKGGLPIWLPHDDVVRALACTPVGAARNLCVAGAGGKLYLWDLDRAALGDGRQKVEPLDVKADANTGPESSDYAHITCLAFSPDGKYFASGGDDGSIALWTLAEGDNGKLGFSLVYRFDHDHGVDQGHTDPITALTFTPQCLLVSASSDKTIRIWRLKEKGVILDGSPIANRDGNVPKLGVRGDGKWLLFDKGNQLQFLSLERPGENITTLQNSGAAAPFETLALFSPNGELLLTAGLPEGKMQLWKAPTETKRGYPVREYLPADKQFPVTCAAFFPQHPYAVSGTAGGEVYFWELPSDEEIKDFRIKDVPVRLLSQSIDPNTHQIRIAIDVDNSNGRLRPGRAVTVVIGEE
jgi:WD40 repeat protein